MSAHGDRLVPARLGWHPLTVAGVMAILAAAAASAAAAGSALGRAGPWLVMGAAAGFATSGSV
jgi:hypothetical protein